MKAQKCWCKLSEEFEVESEVQRAALIELGIMGLNLQKQANEIELTAYTWKTHVFSLIPIRLKSLPHSFFLH